jgi:hypothetical protein
MVQFDIFSGDMYIILEKVIQCKFHQVDQVVHSNRAEKTADSSSSFHKNHNPLCPNIIYLTQSHVLVTP